MAARDTPQNRALVMEMMEAELSETGRDFPESIAAATLEVMAMPDGVAKTRIYSVATVIGEMHGPMSVLESVGRAFLLKRNGPVEFIELARRAAAAATEAVEEPQIHRLPREIRSEGRGKNLYVFGAGPNLTTFASAKSKAEALEIVQRPGHPHFNCTVEEVNAAIRRAATARAAR